MHNLTPYFDFLSPHCLFTMILLGGSEEDLRVFTSETSNAKAKSSENFLKLISHRANGLYGHACTVNAYGHPKICRRYGLELSAHTVSMVSSYGLYGHARSPVRPVRSPVRSLRSVVRSIRSVATVSTVMHGHPER